MHFFDYDTRIAGYAVLIDEHDRILLSWYNGTGMGDACWSLPGGGIDFGESIEDGVVREVLEETGYRVRLGRPLGTHSFTRPDWGRDGRPFNSVRIFFEAVTTGGALGTLEMGGTTDSAAWLPLTEIVKQPAVADVVIPALEAVGRYGSVLPRSVIGVAAPGSETRP